MYIRALGGWYICGGILMVFVVAQLAEVGVSIALRYWAQSYDNRQESVSSMAIAAIHHSAARWRIRSEHATLSSMLSSQNLQASEINDGRSPSYWLKMYCVVAAVNLFFYGARVAFMLWRGLAASKTIYTELMEKILGAPSEFRQCSSGADTSLINHS